LENHLELCENGMEMRDLYKVIMACDGNVLQAIGSTNTRSEHAILCRSQLVSCLEEVKQSAAALLQLRLRHCCRAHAKRVWATIVWAMNF
jgi:hypothetical protein